MILQHVEHRRVVGRDAVDALRQQMRDPVFLPRPVWFVDQLPRNAASKLPRAALLALYQQHNRATGAAA